DRRPGPGPLARLGPGAHGGQPPARGPKPSPGLRRLRAPRPVQPAARRPHPRRRAPPRRRAGRPRGVRRRPHGHLLPLRPLAGRALESPVNAAEPRWLGKLWALPYTLLGLLLGAIA